MCGLSSGSGEGAGMLGDRVESRCDDAGTGRLEDRSGIRIISLSGLRLSTLESSWCSACDSRIVVEALSGRSVSALEKAAVDAECGCSRSGVSGDTGPSMNGSEGLIEPSFTPSNVEEETPCCT